MNEPDGTDSFDATGRAFEPEGGRSCETRASTLDGWRQVTAFRLEKNTPPAVGYRGPAVCRTGWPTDSPQLTRADCDRPRTLRCILA